MDSKLKEPGIVLLREEQIQARLLEQLWRITAVVIFIAGLGSISRAASSGWLWLYSFQIGLILLGLLFFFFRNRASYQLRVAVLLCIFYGGGISGLFALGLLSAGVWWLILSALLATVFYSPKVGILHSAFCIAIIAVAGFLYTRGFVEQPFDANAYVRRPQTWILLGIGCVLLSMFIFAALITYQRETVNLLREVERSRNEYQKAMDEIQLLRSFLPICAQCKKVRDDEGYWENVESYLQKRSELKFSHCLCPDCGYHLYGELWNDAMRDKKLEEQGPH